MKKRKKIDTLPHITAAVNHQTYPCGIDYRPIKNCFMIRNREGHFLPKASGNTGERAIDNILTKMIPHTAAKAINM